MSDKPVSSYVPFYTSDFLGGTGGMTAATKGVYITLLCLIYEEEGPLTQSWDSLARRCGCTLPAFRKAIEALEQDRKVEVLDSGLWSPKCEKHMTVRRERRNSAKAAAEKRWEKTKQKQGQADANAVRGQCQPEPEPEYKKETPKGVSKKTASRGTRLPDDWHLPQPWGAWAVEQGWPPDAVRVEAEKFRDYWCGLSGQRATKRDWQATWRNWIRNARPPLQSKPQGGQESGADRARRIAAMVTGGVDHGTGADPSQPLLPAGPTDGRGGPSSSGLGADIVSLSARRY